MLVGFNPYQPRKAGEIYGGTHDYRGSKVSIHTSPERLVKFRVHVIKIRANISFNPYQPRKAGEISKFLRFSDQFPCFNPYQPRKAGEMYPYPTLSYSGL